MHRAWLCPHICFTLYHFIAVVLLGVYAFDSDEHTEFKHAAFYVTLTSYILSLAIKFSYWCCGMEEKEGKRIDFA
jgi:hypothetical protein